MQDPKTPTATGQPASLQWKRQCLDSQIEKWKQEGKDLQPIGEILKDFPPLFEQQKFAEAEQIVDRALKVTGGMCSDQQASPRNQNRLEEPAEAAQPSGRASPFGKNLTMVTYVLPLH
jgi:hypothetical protein